LSGLAALGVLLLVTLRLGLVIDQPGNERANVLTTDGGDELRGAEERDDVALEVAGVVAASALTEPAATADVARDDAPPVLGESLLRRRPVLTVRDGCRQLALPLPCIVVRAARLLALLAVRVAVHDHVAVPALVDARR